MTDARICFSGTPQLAADHLARMIEAGYVPELVISQPDRPAGRGRKLHVPEVKQLAQAHDIEVWQPESIRKRALIDRFVERQFDIHIVVAFGQILAPRMLDAPRCGTFNSHASLLPRWRGAAPIEWALLSGDEVTGVALQRMVRELDAGPIVGVREIPITRDDDRASLYEKLGKLGGTLVVDELPLILDGRTVETPQPEEGITWAVKLTREHSPLDLSQSAQALRNHVRALHPHPGSRLTAVLDDDTRMSLKVVEARVVPDDEATGLLAGHDVVPAPGTLLDAHKRLVVATGDGLLEIRRVQPESKRAMSAEAFCNGHHAVRLENG